LTFVFWVVPPAAPPPGQKHRISIARAIYADADIYILDDPLAAVDAHVGKHIWQHAITGFMRDKAVVLVTNQLQHVSDDTVSEVIVMAGGGVIAERGSYSQLASTGGGTFAQMLRKRAAGSRESSLPSDAVDSGGGDAEPASSASAKESAPGSSPGPAAASPKQLVLAEKRHQGGVPLKRYLDYYRVVGEPCVTTSMLSLFPASEVLTVVQDWWLGMWSTQSFGAALGDGFYLGVFCMLALLGSLLILVRSLIYARFAVFAATSLHDAALERILFTPLLFFERNPIGRAAVVSLACLCVCLCAIR
jgi:ABC-type multidrug transport system fused ATPase/permease subunit